MDAPVICTIVAKNYLAHARCLTESFLEQHPDGRVFVLLADERGDYFDPAGERFTTLEAHDLGIPNFDQMAFRYTVVEFNTAVKPFLLEHLFETYQLQSLCYFDPDIYFYQPLTELMQVLEQRNVVLTPHLLDPLDDDKLPDEPYILRAGVYNLGFIGLSRGPELLKLLRWWQQKLVKDCVIDATRGLFVDQRWIDLVPALFESVATLRNPGYNAAYWNLKHRLIHERDGTWCVNDAELLTFYHFSGLPMHEISAISKHQNRYTLDDRPTMRPLFEHYRDRLLANGYETVRRWPYAYNVFDRGVSIPDAARHLWRNLDDGVRWPHPFDTTAHDSFLAWLNHEAQPDISAAPLITNLALEIYRSRWDLQQAFPDVLGTHRLRFARWFAEKAPEQYTLDPLFTEPMRTSASAALRGGVTPLAPHAPAALPTMPIPQPSGLRGQLYYAMRVPLRRLGLHTLMKRLIGQRRIDRLYTLLLLPRRAAPVEAPLIGKPTRRRRLYYAMRNPLHRAGLHQPLKRLLGQQRVEAIFERMVGQPQLRPEAITRTLQRPPMPALPPTASPGVNIVGYVRAETGMGEVPRAIARALAAAGYPVAITDLSNANWARAEDTSIAHLPTGNSHAYTLLCVNADMVPATIRQLGPAFFSGKYTIGFWHWETATFPVEWHDRFAQLSEIWVDSSYVQATIAAAATIPVVNVHLPINALQPSAITRAELGLPGDRWLFLFSFDMRSFMQRKNPFGLIEAYRRAFGSDACHTSLVIKVTNAEAFPAEAAQLRAELAAVGGILIDRYLDRSDLSGLFGCCDCYVSLHRSEGFGLTMAEAMALGKPVIATAYSGNMEFMTPANSYLVGYQLVALDEDHGPYRKGGEWADPDLDHAAQLMREVVEHPEDAQCRGRRAAADLRARFSSEEIARRMIQRITILEQRRR